MINPDRFLKSLLLSGLLLTGGAAMAQNAATHEPGVVNWPYLDIGAYQNGLELDRNTVGALKDVEVKFSNQWRALPADLSVEQRRAERDRLVAERAAEALTVLTPEQRQRWAKIHTTKAPRDITE